MVTQEKIQTLGKDFDILQGVAWSACRCSCVPLCCQPLPALLRSPICLHCSQLNYTPMEDSVWYRAWMWVCEACAGKSVCAWEVGEVPRSPLYLIGEQLILILIIIPTCYFRVTSCVPKGISCPPVIRGDVWVCGLQWEARHMTGGLTNELPSLGACHYVRGVWRNLSFGGEAYESRVHKRRRIVSAYVFKSHI